MLEADDHFDSVAAKFTAHTQHRPEFAERFALFRTAIDRSIERSEAVRALDLGCGPGDLSVHLAKRGLRVCFLDGSQEMVALTTRRLKASDALQHATPLHAHLPLDEEELHRLGRFHLIVSSSVLEYIDDDCAVVGQCSQILEQGGTFLFSVPNDRSIYWRFISAFQRLRLLRDSDFRLQKHRYGPTAVRSMMSTHNLRLESVAYFSLPLQRWWPAPIKRRPPWLSTMMLCEARRT